MMMRKMQFCSDEEAELPFFFDSYFNKRDILTFQVPYEMPLGRRVIEVLRVHWEFINHADSGM